jgi:DNA repair protein RecN (Recombination protein N)
MLQQLHIENYALIDRLALEFGPGLNLLTGETGSGKSIVVDALGLLLGGRPSPEAIRAGTERAVLCGVFQTATPHELRRAAEELGIELQPTGELLVKRELHVSGRTRVFINDRPATVGALRALAPWLGDIHGQNEQQALFLRAPQLELLDHYAGAEDAVQQVTEAFDDWRRAGARLAELTRNEQEKLRLADLWSFQKQEIEAARPEPEEDQRLVEEKRVLANSTRIQAAVQTAYEQIYEGPGAAGGAVAAALRALEEVARFDARLQPLCDSLRGARITIEDASLSLRDYLERLDANPQRLEQVEDRLAALDRLKRKYGPSLVDVLGHLERVSRQLEELESSDELARQAQQQMEAAATRYRELAGQLSGRRKTAAVRLEKAVARILGELAMENTRFSIQFAPLEKTQTGGDGGWSATGIDRTEFLISPNPGEPLRPVDQVASGGELSRLMLALKTAVEELRGPESGAPESGKPGRQSRRAAADTETARTLVFDEIDAGIGGRVAETVGRKLKALAGAHQVLCVTHLPQIASFADQHFYVEKMEQEGRTVTRARRLDDNERAAELARMLSGTRITDTVLKHARDMLRAAK